MDNINILAESVIKIEKIKEEVCDYQEESLWKYTEDQNSPEQCLLKVENDAEDEELEPPIAVFIEPNKCERDFFQEDKDPLASCSEDVPALIKEENDFCFQGE
ncbi:hypothetical protein R5R35_009683 [Gryllus longicercus]|uniref:Uncharacterized protein n=1 Tax=Gryllus longicercus TaxID=2509291 RepID=A0AAN9Z3L5_9ORTH